MEENKTPQSDQLSDDQLKDVAGGASVQQRRLDRQDVGTKSAKSVDDIQDARLDHQDNQTK